jgi:hypothetical protein
LVLFQVGIQRPHGVEDAQASTDGPLGIVFVGLREAKVHQQAIAQILGDRPVKVLDDLDPGRLISQHHLAQVFGVELAGERGRLHQVAEQHGELAAFGFWGTSCGSWWLSLCDLGSPPLWLRGCGSWLLPGEGDAASTTKLLAGLVHKPAGGAGER